MGFRPAAAGLLLLSSLELGACAASQQVWVGTNPKAGDAEPALVACEQQAVTAAGPNYAMPPGLADFDTPLTWQMDHATAMKAYDTELNACMADKGFKLVPASEAPAS